MGLDTIQKLGIRIPPEGNNIVTKRGAFNIQFTSSELPYLYHVQVVPELQVKSKQDSEIIYQMQENKNPPHQVVIDSGAAGTVVGTDWLNSKNLSWKSEAIPSSRRFTFGSGRTYESLGSILISLPVASKNGLVEYLTVNAEILKTKGAFNPKTAL